MKFLLKWRHSGRKGGLSSIKMLISVCIFRKRSVVGTTANSPHNDGPPFKRARPDAQTSNALAAISMQYGGEALAGAGGDPHEDNNRKRGDHAYPRPQVCRGYFDGQLLNAAAGTQSLGVGLALKGAPESAYHVDPLTAASYGLQAAHYVGNLRGGDDREPDEPTGELHGASNRCGKKSARRASGPARQWWQQPPPTTTYASRGRLAAAQAPAIGARSRTNSATPPSAAGGSSRRPGPCGPPPLWRGLFSVGGRSGAGTRSSPTYHPYPFAASSANHHISSSSRPSGVAPPHLRLPNNKKLHTAAFNSTQPSQPSWIKKEHNALEDTKPTPRDLFSNQQWQQHKENPQTEDGGSLRWSDIIRAIMRPIMTVRRIAVRSSIINTAEQEEGVLLGTSLNLIIAAAVAAAAARWIQEGSTDHPRWPTAASQRTRQRHYGKQGERPQQQQAAATAGRRRLHGEP